MPRREVSHPAPRESAAIANGGDVTTLPIAIVAPASNIPTMPTTVRPYFTPCCKTNRSVTHRPPGRKQGWPETAPMQTIRLAGHRIHER